MTFKGNYMKTATELEELIWGLNRIISYDEEGDGMPRDGRDVIREAIVTIKQLTKENEKLKNNPLL